MSLFQKIEKSPLNLVIIKMKDGEVIKVSLSKELILTERTLNSAIKEQPVNYTYLSVLYKKAIAEYDRAESETQRIMGRLFKSIKTDRESDYYTTNHRAPSDDLTTNMVLAHPKYVAANEEKIEAKERMMILGSLVKGFEQKADLIQTLSANLRREK